MAKVNTPLNGSDFRSILHFRRKNPAKTLTFGPRKPFTFLPERLPFSIRSKTNSGPTIFNESLTRAVVWISLMVYETLKTFRRFVISGKCFRMSTTDGFDFSIVCLNFSNDLLVRENCIFFSSRMFTCSRACLAMFAQSPLCVIIINSILYIK